jgi:hypothetical protein
MVDDLGPGGINDLADPLIGGQSETGDELREAGGYVLEGAEVFGGEAAADALLAGGAGAAELGAGAAAAGGAAIVGTAAVGFGLGLGIGTVIEKETGIGSASGDALYNISDANDAQDALHHSEAAETAWDAGEYGTAASEAAQTAGSMIEGVWDGLTGDSSEE